MAWLNGARLKLISGFLAALPPKAARRPALIATRNSFLRAAEGFHAITQLRRSCNCQCWQLIVLPGKETGAPPAICTPNRNSRNRGTPIVNFDFKPEKVGCQWGGGFCIAQDYMRLMLTTSTSILFLSRSISPEISTRSFSSMERLPQTRLSISTVMDPVESEKMYLSLPK